MVLCSTGWFRAAVAGLALLCSAYAAPAQDPSPAAVAMARQVVDLKGVANLYDPVLTGIVIRSRDALMATNPMLSGELNAVAQQLRKEFQPRLDALKQQVAKFYAERFTEEELKQVLAFYKSPLGAKVRATEPKVLEQSMGYADKWAAQVADEMLARMRAEMRKRGHEL